jgi:hypothetical protein
VIGEPTAPTSNPRRIFRALVTAFVAYAVVTLLRRWDLRSVTCSGPLALSSLVPLLGALVCQAEGWRALLRSLSGEPVPHRQAIALYFDSQLARYLPGKVGLPGVRIAGGRALGVSPRAVAASLVLEAAAWLAMGSAVACLASLGPHGERAPWLRALSRAAWPFTAGLGGLVLALALLDRRRLPARLRQWFQVPGAGPLVPAGLLSWQAGCWAGWSLHAVLLTISFGGGGRAAVESVGLWALGAVGGVLAPLAPAGLGAREAVLSLGLAPTLGAAPALTFALASRALALIAELALWLGARGARIVTRWPRRGCWFTRRAG